MKIVQINTFDINGGAARAAYRLHKGLIEIGEDCRTVVKKKSAIDERVIQIQVDKNTENTEEPFFLSLIQNYYINAHRTQLSNTTFSLPYPGIDVSGLSELKKADVINLHWVAWYQSVVTLKKLFSLGKPIVWTLHDQWPFTGGCHYSAGCSKYRTDCSRCPQLEDDPFDLAAAVLKDKLDLFKGADLTIVTPSKWLASCAKESTLFKDLRVEVIPNSLETDVFVPQPKAEAKQKIGVSPDDITILFGAEQGNEKRKGFHELVTAMQHCMSDASFRNIAEKGRLKILCFGYASNELQNMGLPVVPLGYLTADEDLRDAYSAADLFVLPSLEDNLPNTMLESLSCATPVVAFDTGGITDIIIEGETGRLASMGDSAALGHAILAMISDPVLRNRMGQTGRERMISGYSLKIQAKKYLDLYKELRNQSSVNQLAGNVSTHEKHVTGPPSFDTSLGDNFRRIYDGVQVKALREAAPVIQMQLTQCIQLKAERDATIKEQNVKINQIWGMLGERDDHLRRANEQIKGRNEHIRELETQIKDERVQIRQKYEELGEEKQKLREEKREVEAKIEELRGQNLQMEKDLIQKNNRINDLLNSWSWKVTKPLRSVAKITRGK